jgi:hypothetical protein
MHKSHWSVQFLTNVIMSECEWIIRDTIDNFQDTYWRINSILLNIIPFEYWPTTKQKADQGQTLVLGYATETSMRTVLTLMYEYAVLAEGRDVHTKDFCCQWHYVLVGGRDFGCMNIWGLQPHWLDRVGWKPVWPSVGKRGSFGRRPPRLMTGTGHASSLNHILAFAWQMWKTTGLPKGARWSSFCRLGRFAAQL